MQTVQGVKQQVQLPRNGRAYTALLIGGDKGYDTAADILKTYGIAIVEHWTRADNGSLARYVDKPFPDVEVLLFMHSAAGPVDTRTLWARAQAAKYRSIRISHRKAQYSLDLQREGFEANPAWLRNVRNLEALQAAAAKAKPASVAVAVPVEPDLPESPTVDDEEEPPSPHARIKAHERGEPLPMPKPPEKASPEPSDTPKAVPRRAIPRIVPYPAIRRSWDADDIKVVREILANTTDPLEILEFFYVTRGYYRTLAGVITFVETEAKDALPPVKYRTLISRRQRDRNRYIQDEKRDADAGQIRGREWVSRELVLTWTGNTTRYAKAEAEGWLSTHIDTELDLPIVALKDALFAVSKLGVFHPRSSIGVVTSPDLAMTPPDEEHPPMPQVESRPTTDLPDVGWPKGYSFRGGRMPRTSAEIDNLILTRLGVVSSYRWDVRTHSATTARLRQLEKQRKIIVVNKSSTYSEYCLPAKIGAVRASTEAYATRIRRELLELHAKVTPKPADLPPPVLDHDDVIEVQAEPVYRPRMSIPPEAICEEAQAPAMPPPPPGAIAPLGLPVQISVDDLRAARAQMYADAADGLVSPEQFIARMRKA